MPRIFPVRQNIQYPIKKPTVSVKPQLKTLNTGNLISSILKDANDNPVLDSNGNVQGGNISAVNLTTSGNISTLGITTIGNVTVGGITNMKNLVVDGTITTTGNASIGGITNMKNLVVDGTTTTTGNIAVGGNLTTQNINSTGNASIGGNITSGTITTTGNVNIGGIFTTSNIVSGSITTTNNLSVGSTITCDTLVCNNLSYNNGNITNNFITGVANLTQVINSSLPVPPPTGPYVYSINSSDCGKILMLNNLYQYTNPIINEVTFILPLTTPELKNKTIFITKQFRGSTNNGTTVKIATTNGSISSGGALTLSTLTTLTDNLPSKTFYNDGTNWYAF
jgi:hypothetical protein